eukprot:IDg4786t1
MLAVRFGMGNLPRLRRYFTDKARRMRLRKDSSSTVPRISSVDVQRLREMESFLFPNTVGSELCPTVLCGLRHILRLENVSGIHDVGHALHTKLKTPEGLCALRAFQGHIGQI